MATNFPGSLDAFNNPAAGDKTNNLTTPHHAQHANANDAIEAIQAKLGIGSSTAAAGRILGGSGAGASAWKALGAAGQLLRVNLAGTDFEWFTPPKVRAYHNASQSIPNSALTALTFNTDRIDSEAMHDTGSNTNRLTAITPGFYLIFGTFRWAVNNTGYRQLLLRHQGSTYIMSAEMPAVQGAATDMIIATGYQLAANEYVELLGFQDSGGALNMESGGNYSPEFGMVWMAP